MGSQTYLQGNFAGLDKSLALQTLHSKRISKKETNVHYTQGLYEAVVEKTDKGDGQDIIEQRHGKKTWSIWYPLGSIERSRVDHIEEGNRWFLFSDLSPSTGESNHLRGCH